MEVSHSLPNLGDYTPLSDQQSRTPESFFSGPPVLYHHSSSTTLLINSHDLEAAPALAALVSGAHRDTNGTSVHTNGDESGEEDTGQELESANIDVWVTSERLILCSSSKIVSVSIAYPSISLHAVQGSTNSNPASLFLQILTKAQTFDDHDPDSTISLTIVPTPMPPAPTAAETGEEAADSQPQNPVRTLFIALSACANLHPDPESESEVDDGNGQSPAIMFEGDADMNGIYPLSNGGSEGAGLPPPMPGSGGWITAENVNEFFDEEGNFRGGGLGGGAGSVRAREEGEEEEGNGDGMEDETKWRRTE